MKMHVVSGLLTFSTGRVKTEEVSFSQPGWFCKQANKLSHYGPSQLSFFLSSVFFPLVHFFLFSVPAVQPVFVMPCLSRPARS